MKPDIFFGFFTLFFALASGFVTYLFGIRPLKQKERCTEKTVGKITRLSNIRQGDLYLPLVEYTVDGRQYRVAGPKFRSVITTDVPTLRGHREAEYETNLTTRENLPDSLRIRRRGNFFYSSGTNPFYELYPVGSEVPVYYNPYHPKESYVQRFVGPPKILGVLLGLLTVMFLIMSLVMFALPSFFSVFEW